MRVEFGKLPQKVQRELSGFEDAVIWRDDVPDGAIYTALTSQGDGAAYTATSMIAWSEGKITMLPATFTRRMMVDAVIEERKRKENAA